MDLKRISLVSAAIMCLLMTSVFVISPMKVEATIPSSPSIMFRLSETQNAGIYSNSPNQNWSDSWDPAWLRIYRNYETSPEYLRRAYWQFDMESLPDNLVIDQVKGYFYLISINNFNVSWGWGSFSMPVYKVAGPWTQDNLTWNTAPPVVYGDDLVQYVSIPRRSPTNDVTSTNPWQNFFCYYEIDLTTLARAWYAGTTPNYGVFFTLEFEYDTQDIDVYWQGGGTSPGAQLWNPDEPYLSVYAHSTESQVHISYYDSFTGDGIAPWTFNVSTSINGAAYQRTTPDQTNGLLGENLTIVVRDFFGNELYNQTRLITVANYYWDIGLPVYSYKFYSQNPVFSLLKIYYNLAGTPYSEFIPPYDHVDRFLKAGTYRFNITFYNASGVQGSEYTWIRTIPSINFPGAGFVILQGDTISEVIQTVTGMQAVVQVVVDLVTPALITVGHNMPSIPSSISSVSATAIQNNLYFVNGNTLYTDNGTNMSFPDPYPVAKLSPTTASDDFTFTGSYYTSLYVNETNGTVAYNSTVLPSMVALAGHEYNVWTNQSVSVARDINWRWYRAFTYQYFPNTKLYITTIEIENTAIEPWRNVTLFVPFQNASYVDNRSVAVWDINNTAYLIEGQHFLLTKDGIFMWWPSWNVSLDRAFTVTYQAINETWNQLPVEITVNMLGDGTTLTMPFQNRDYYYVLASWTNTYREQYDGPLYIKLDLTVSIDPDSVIVLTDSGAIVTDAIVAGTTIIIPRIVVGVGQKISYTILFDNKQSTSVLDFTLGSIPVILIAAFVTAFAFVVGAMFMISKREKQVRYGRVFLGVAVLGIILMIVIYMYYLATG